MSSTAPRSWLGAVIGSAASMAGGGEAKPEDEGGKKPKKPTAKKPTAKKPAAKPAAAKKPAAKKK